MHAKDNYKKQMMNIIISNIPGTMREWSRESGISIGTFSGWKNGSHLPRGASFEIFKDYVSKNLTVQEKEKIFWAIFNQLRIDFGKKDFVDLQKIYKADFATFIDYIINEYVEEQDSNAIVGNRDISMLNQILISRFQTWLGPMVGEITADDVGPVWGCIGISLINKHGVGECILISYSLEPMDGTEIEEYVKRQYAKEKYQIHILLCEKRLGHIQDAKLTGYDHVYVGTFDLNHISEMVLDTHFVTIQGTQEAVLLELNRIAKVIFDKIVEYSYLIYKHFLCVYTKEVWLTEGNLKYPRAMWDAIVFERGILMDIIEGFLEKPELIMDFNCLGGLQGVHLFRHCNKIVCMDACQKVLDGIEEQIDRYTRSEKDPYARISNIETKRLRVDMSDILDNEDYYGKVDMILMGLGAASLYQEIPDFYHKLKLLLKEDGHMVISCYNQNSLSIQLHRYDQSGFVYDEHKNCMIFHDHDFMMPVPVRLYTAEEFQADIQEKAGMEIAGVWSYPTLTGVIAGNDPEMERYWDMITELDREGSLAVQGKITCGLYNIIHAIKK